jgi:hypothetical protein
MKTQNLFFLSLFISTPVLLTGTTASAAVTLNEVMVDSADGDGSLANSGEWVELFGISGDDIGGWVISDGDMPWRKGFPSNSITIPTGTVIPADGFYLVGNSTIGGLLPDFDTSGNYPLDGTTAIPELSLVNSGEFVGLFDASLSLIDGLIWIENVVGDPNAPSGQSLMPFGGGTLTIPNLADVGNPPSPWSWINTDGANGESLARITDGTGT